MNTIERRLTALEQEARDAEQPGPGVLVYAAPDSLPEEEAMAKIIAEMGPMPPNSLVVRIRRFDSEFEDDDGGVACPKIVSCSWGPSKEAIP